jgi:hypothetical protein
VPLSDDAAAAAEKRQPQIRESHAPSTINARLTVINIACTRAVYEARHCEAARAELMRRATATGYVCNAR